jgi:Mrp family chromosome partitioning ATPase
VTSGQGLSDILAAGAEPGSVVQNISLGRPADNGSAPHMDVIFAGPPLANPVDPIESELMENLLGEARVNYDLVVVDTPPISVVPDAIPIIRYVDGVILVSRVGTITRDAAEHVQGQLDNLGAPTLGIVVNGIGPRDGHYGYAYGAADSRRPKAEPFED